MSETRVDQPLRQRLRGAGTRERGGRAVSACPNCGCPFTTGTGFRTADMPRSWQDETGKWFRGPANESWTEICDNCGRTVERVWERGKLVRDDVTHRGCAARSEEKKPKEGER